MSKVEAREFRLRPRKPPFRGKRGEVAAWANAYKTIAHYARISRSMKLGKGSPRSTTRRLAIPRSQRCAIRLTYSSNTTRGHWRAHGRYIARETAARELSAAGFDAEKHGIDIAAKLESWQAAGDQRMWKIIISPEFGDRVDLTRLTRDLMGRVERDLGVPLEWTAVGHFNTEHPHVHVALRGVGRERQQIYFDRDYLKNGIRSLAEDFCTRQIGHRTNLDAAEAERREIREKRITSLDRVILKGIVRPSPDHAAQVAMPIDGRKPGESDFAWTRRQRLIARLTVLEEMGLAQSIGIGRWSLRSDFEAVLRAMQRTGDRQKTLTARGLFVSDERLPIEALDFRRTPSVEGRVLVHGEDEQSGGYYMMLEGVDARVHFIEYTPEIEGARARGLLRPNAFARLRRIRIGEKEAMHVEDLGDSEALLKRRSHFETEARKLLTKRISPAEGGWGGWLGRYHATLKQACVAMQEPNVARDRARATDLSR